MKGVQKKGYKRVQNTSINILDKSKDKAQIETYHYLVEEFLTPLQIAKRRNVSIWAVYKSIKKLTEKGLIKGGYKNEFIKGGEYTVTTNSSNGFRLSALAYTIEILDSSILYENILKRKNQDTLDNNTLMLQKDKIIIYLNKDFFGSDETECTLKGCNYINKFLVMIENNYKIVLSKGRQRYLKEFRCEIEKLNDPLAKKKRLEKDKLIIRDIEDGKARIITDYSFKKDSLEAVKQDKSRKDIRRIDKLWNELLDSDISLLELKESIIDLTKLFESQSKKHNFLLDTIGNLSILQKNEAELNKDLRRSIMVLAEVIKNKW